jgi:leucyl-tRNA synthetase
VGIYLETVKNKTDLSRTDLAKEKTGVFSGAFAKHPVTGALIPIWIADYVLMTYGTGAVMAVPAHDERDHAFAKNYQLPLQEVVSGGVKSIEDEAFTGSGTCVNSGFLDGLATEEAKGKIIDWLEKHAKGKSRTTYRLRDWLFSRQRYWGEPFPILHSSDDEIVPVPLTELPVELPPIDEYRPTQTGEPPLARAPESWLFVDKKGVKFKRETNTMPQWAGSCWYYLRFMDPQNEKEPWSKELENYWMPVDLYIGGVEHAVLHLLYARFWHKVLYDAGLVHTKEPFQKLFNQGMILGQSFQDTKGKYYPFAEVEQAGSEWRVKSTQDKVTTQIEKMSKSRLNVVSPDDVIDQYGADSMRLYELFMGPLEQTKPWNMDGVEGVSRFLARVWRLVIDDKTGKLLEKLTEEKPDTTPELNRLLHKTIKKVGADISSLAFNTAISQMMIFCNEATQSPALPKHIVLDFLKILNPFAPHLTEELWERLGQKPFLSVHPWPKYEEKLCAENTVTVVLQINGKIKDKIEVEKGLSKELLEKKALENTKIQAALSQAGGTTKKIIVVPDRLVNLVV